MPRFPGFAASVTEIRGSVFSSLAHRLEGFAGETFPLHVGDTWMEPAEGCRMEDLTVAEYPGMHRYAPPHGLPALVRAVVERTEARTGVATAPDDVLLAAGATGGLGAVLGALLAPGDEVLILAPHWPLISGIVRSFHGKPVAVPFLAEGDGMGREGEDAAAGSPGRIGDGGRTGGEPPATPEEAVARVAAHLTERTVALYLNTPNNPTGRLIPRDQVEALVRWAAERDLWVLSDEVYEDYAWGGPHTYARPFAPERTFSAYSFSKGYGMAGNRCGYVVGPSEAMAQVRKVSTHTFYCAPTAAQLAALRCLQGSGDGWVARAREEYRRLGDAAADRLGVPRPEGSTFLFLDVAGRLDERGLVGFLEDCVDRGLFLAPGPSFGPFPTHVRVCFTSVEPPRVERGIEVLARLLGR